MCVERRPIDYKHFLVFERFKFHHQYSPSSVSLKHYYSFIVRSNRLSTEAPAFFLFSFSFSIGFSVTSYNLKKSSKASDTSLRVWWGEAEWGGLG